MNWLLLSFLTFVVLAIVFAEKDMYTTKYDNIDIDKILDNDRIFRSYIDCCLDRGKCTSDGLELKKNIKAAIENECEKCSEAQKKAIKKVGKKLYEEKPNWWQELCDHFDPDKKYRTKYQKYIDDALAEEDD
nr:ejaculatory bulb-specific protein 3-like [Leptinotarsa decemlineata]